MASTSLLYPDEEQYQAPLSLLQPPDERPPILQPDPRADALGRVYQQVMDYVAARQREATPIWHPDNPVGTETLQSAGMPLATTYAGPIGQFIDPATGQLTAQGAERLDNPALGFDTGGVAGMARRAAPLRVFHGSMENLDAFDPTRVGSGAMEGRWAAAAKHADEYYLTTDREHASTYGPNINEFEINKPLLKKNGKAELTAWAKNQGYKSAQHQLDEYYGGDIYDAMDLDNYLKDALREAKSSGFPGVHVSFGDLKALLGNRKVPVGDFVVLHDPSVATKVSP